MKEEKIKKILNDALVVDHKTWGDDRIYLTLRGFSWSYKGCKTTKIWIDKKTGSITITRGSGISPSEFNKSLDAFSGKFIEKN